jgi:hypothetical protein
MFSGRAEDDIDEEAFGGYSFLAVSSLLSLLLAACFCECASSVHKRRLSEKLPQLAWSVVVKVVKAFVSGEYCNLGCYRCIYLFVLSQLRMMRC